MIALRSWLLNRAIPLWLHHGIDRQMGGFHEALSPGHYGCDTPFRRLRVAARHVTAFSLAYRASLRHAGASATPAATTPTAAEAVERGVHFLTRHAALPEGGYAWRFDLSNNPIDHTRDLYDHAFVLLALSEAAAILPPNPLRARALALLDFLDRHMRHPSGGWVESIPPALPRRQNPHMHLLEALLAAHRAFGDLVFLARAAQIVALFLDRLLDWPTGALPEHFDDALRPERRQGRFAAEPGHHHEWAWLLGQFASHAPPDERRDQAAAALLRFAAAHGEHPATGDVIDAVGSDGAPLARTARLWPQTERLRTAFAAGGTGRAQAAASVAAYLHPDGLWHERRAEDGAFLAGPSPASSLYHLTTGILGASDAAAAPD